MILNVSTPRKNIKQVQTWFVLILIIDIIALGLERTSSNRIGLHELQLPIAVHPPCRFSPQSHWIDVRHKCIGYIETNGIHHTGVAASV